MAPSLTDVVDTRIGSLQPEVRAVVEFVAHGEPIGLPLLTQATDARAVERRRNFSSSGSYRRAGASRCGLPIRSTARSSAGAAR